MPRDLFSDDLILTASPEAKTPKPTAYSDQDTSPNHFTIISDDSDRDLKMSDLLRKSDRDENLHPFVQVLSINDLESCVALENAAFPESERCSREKFIYRLTTCPELCLGLFSSTTISPSPNTEAVHAAARPPDSTTPSHRALLLAHVIATQTSSLTVTDSSIQIPTGSSSHPSSGGTRLLADSGTKILGHDQFGSTIAVHSLAVLPSHQNRSLGRTLFKSYLQRMEGSAIAKRCAIIVHPELVKFYAGLGFANMGESQVTLAGGGWTDMVCFFPRSEEKKGVKGNPAGFDGEEWVDVDETDGLKDTREQKRRLMLKNLAKRLKLKRGY